MKRRRPTIPHEYPGQECAQRLEGERADFLEQLNAFVHLQGKELLTPEQYKIVATEKGLAVLSADVLRVLADTSAGAGRMALYALLTRINGLAAQQDPAPKGFILDLFMPPDRAGDALYNILGRYDYWVDTHGRRKARWIFFTQSAGVILSFWTEWLMHRLKLLRFLRHS